MYRSIPTEGEHTMSERLAPTIVVEIHRYTEPDRFGFHTLTPAPGWNIYPLGKDQPSYCRNVVLLNADTSDERREDLLNDEYDHLTWDELPEYLQAWVIGQEAPDEYKVGLGTGNPGLTNAVSVWVKGTLPTDASMETVEEELERLAEKAAL